VKYGAAQMSEQANFSLRGHNPDVLSCIANLSNDEVFTPPELANQMLDTLANAWASNNNGASLWENKTVKFLDPGTKSGVFLREITKRLTTGLALTIPDLEQRVTHILTQQIFGIGLTQITSLLARRSLYCSKNANGIHSITKAFNTSDGNIWFQQSEHTWINGRCKYCGAGRSTFDRAAGLESHAYMLIHTDEPKSRVAEIFGEKMQFDVVVGNPPYQIDSEGNTRTMPIYQKFIDAAISLDPHYVLMITPSRWFAGGLGLDEFRKKMLTDPRMRVLVDYPNAGDVFPGVEIKGGVSYFLWDSNHSGEAITKTIRAGIASEEISRQLDEFDVLVRESQALPILRKVLTTNPTSFSEIVSPQKPFGLLSNFSTYSLKKVKEDDYHFYGVSKGKRIDGWVEKKYVSMNAQFAEVRKVLIPEAGSDGGKTENDSVIGRPWIVPGNSVCTQTFMFVAALDDLAGKSIASYLATKFVRFLISLRKISQHTKADTYLWVPQQSWDRIWTDKELYKKYSLTTEEVKFIERMIRSMELTETQDA